jgi:hypothetical protein
MAPEDRAVAGRGDGLLRPEASPGGNGDDGNIGKV